MLKILRFVNLLLVALTLGMTFSHALEYPGKAKLDGVEWLTVQHNVYLAFGVVGAIIEVTAILTTWIVFAQIRSWKLARVLTLLAGLATTAALGIWFGWVDPVNTALKAWTPETMPDNWMSFRDRWEAGHAVSAILFGLAFSALVVAILSETENPQRRFLS
jgi:H+/Cl- antiporter ClcA